MGEHQTSIEREMDGPHLFLGMRAVCSCSWTGSRRATRDEAIVDAATHRGKKKSRT